MNTCQNFLTAMRQIVKEEARALEAKASVSGEAGRYTCHLADGRFHDVDAHCKYCARTDLLEKLDDDAL